MGNVFNNGPKILKLIAYYINKHLEKNVYLKTWFLRIYF
jgi:hypothetical protein